MISIAICEDNPVHIQKLSDLISDFMLFPYTLKIFHSADEFKKHISQDSALFDILFLDIILNHESGITLAKDIHELFPETQVIFISQYLEFVSSVYETEHIYFIYKENLKEFLPLALNKAINKIFKHNMQYLEIFWKRESYYILQKDIIYIERILRVSEIHTTHGVFNTSEKLNLLLPRLNNNFAICHQSFLVNITKIIILEKKYLILDTNLKIPVSRIHYTELKQRLCHLVLD